MNKEEIENKKRMLRDFSEKGQGQRVFFEEDLELIRDVLQELEQKETILDKVTAKLKEDRDLFNKLRKTHKEYSPSEERLTTKYFYILNLLNIIEGEKKNERIF